MLLYIVLTLQLPRCCLTPPRACSSSRVHLDLSIYTVSHRKSIIYVQYTYKVQTFTNDYVCRNIFVCSFSLPLLATRATLSEMRLITIACALIDIARLSHDTFHDTSLRNRAFHHVASGIYTRKLRRTMTFVLLVRHDYSSRRRKRAK